ncbi:MAG: hypothetical protein KatS3mg027_2337 [Bacteroidia bacterium]|nr:MAG: hypothetical protein KatS3mg027_2337 [Bacteroidia bacterium]
MGFIKNLLQLFKNSGNTVNTSNNDPSTDPNTFENITDNTPKMPTVPPEDLFIDKNPPNMSNVQLPDINQEKFIIKDDKDLDTMFQYLMQNIENDGYNDALKVPDMNYMNQNIDRRIFDVLIVLERSILYHKNLLKEIDVHIDRNRNAGFHDIVNQLEKNKEMTLYCLKKIENLMNDFSQRKGYCERIVYSYSIGFKRGIAALTKDEFNLY